MPTIKLQNNKVIITNGKVSCDCCICGGCGKTFYELTNATSINVSFYYNASDAVSGTFSMIEPYTQIGEEIQGDKTLTLSSGECGFDFNWRYTEQYINYTNYISFGIFGTDINNEKKCMARISGGSYGAPDAFYNFSTSGFIDVEISQIFGTHNILENGEGCWAEGNPYGIPPGCNPISGTKTVTIS